MRALHARWRSRHWPNFLPGRAMPKASKSSAAGATKVSDVDELVRRGLAAPAAVMAEIQSMAASDDWRVREVAATALVRIGKKHSEEVTATLKKWTKSKDENIRRASSEGLRGTARLAPLSVLPILEALRADSSLYVKKSVANIL